MRATEQTAPTPPHAHKALLHAVLRTPLWTTPLWTTLGREQTADGTDWLHVQIK